jgi:replication factor C subunit 1
MRRLTQTPNRHTSARVLQATLDALVESSQGDMRLMLGQLQMHRLRARTLSFDQVRAASAKDMDKSPFDCARRLLSGESAQWSMMERMDAVFQDLDLVPLLIQVLSCTGIAKWHGCAWEELRLEAC